MLDTDTGSCRPVDSDCSMLEEDHLGLIIQIPTVDEIPSALKNLYTKKQSWRLASAFLLLLPLLMMKYS